MGKTFIKPSAETIRSLRQAALSIGASELSISDGFNTGTGLTKEAPSPAPTGVIPK